MNLNKRYSSEVTVKSNRFFETTIQLIVAVLMLAASGFLQPIAQGDEIALVASNLEKICKSHRPDCQCPSCRSFFDACSPSCPSVADPQYLPTGPSTLQPPSPVESDGEATDIVNDLLAAQSRPPSITGPITSLPSGLGAIPAPLSSNPGMIGDAFFSGYRYGSDTSIPGATVAIAGGGRVSKIAENSSPVPQDRVFFNYNMFGNAAQDVNGVTQDMNRYLFGTERTFLDGLCSLEFRLPFSGGVDSTQTFGEPDTLATEFGNLTLTFKALIYERKDWSVSTGLGMIFPTAEDAVVTGSVSGVPQIESVFTNESFYLQPFLGVNYSSKGPLFFQFFTQTSFDTSGSVISVMNNNNVFDSLAAPGSDRVFTQSLLFLDFSVGYWIYRPKCQRNFITGIAPIVELHYTSTMNELDLPDFQSATSDDVFESNFRSDLLNITGGVVINMGRSTSLRIAGVAPLREGRDRLFDSEVSAQLVWRY